MFIKTKHYDACIQKVRIEVGTLVGLKADDEAYIVLKELPTLEMLKLKEASEQGENETLTLLRDLLHYPGAQDFEQARDDHHDRRTHLLDIAGELLQPFGIIDLRAEPDGEHLAAAMLIGVAGGKEG